MEKSRFKSFGEYLKYIRMLKGASIKDLSDATGIIDTTLCKYENDKLNVTADNMISICEALHEPIENMNEMWVAFHKKD